MHERVEVELTEAGRSLDFSFSFQIQSDHISELYCMICLCVCVCVWNLQSMKYSSKSDIVS